MVKFSATLQDWTLKFPNKVFCFPRLKTLVTRLAVTLNLNGTEPNESV